MFFGLFGKKEVLCKNCRFAGRMTQSHHNIKTNKMKKVVYLTGLCIYEKIMHGRHKSPVDGKLYYDSRKDQVFCKTRNKNFDCKYYEQGWPSIEQIEKHNNEN